MTIADQLQSIARLFNEKARKRFVGLTAMENVDGLSETTQRVLIHCASYGEFEQIKPLIELIKNNHENSFIIVSFFSPSGYEMANDYTFIDKIVYFPIDTMHNMNVFVDALRPDVVLLVKYEIWINFIDVLTRHNIPSYLVSGLFLPEYIYFKSFAGILRKALKKLTGILVQNKASQKQLETIGIKSDVCGDSRADRVITRSKIENGEINSIAQWKNNKPTLILGSIWQEDWQLFKLFIGDILKEYKLIVAPHEFSNDFLNSILNDAGTGVYWSDRPELDANVSLIILDEMGLLADAYRYGDVAYVGGAFKQGLHNVFEPAVHGLPIIFGPSISRFPEAQMLIALKAANSIRNSKELKDVLMSYIKDPTMRQEKGERARGYVLSSAGSSQRIYSHIKHKLK